MAEDLFLFSLIVFPVILVVGYIFESLVAGKDLGPFTIFIGLLRFIGVVFHELAHYVLCFITRVPTKGISIRLRYEGRINAHGYVAPEYPHKISFLKGMVVAIGPLLIGTWIIYFALEATFNSSLDPFIRIFTGLIVLSTLLASTPSTGDFRFIGLAFNNDPKHSFYQIGLFSLSILVSWGMATLFKWSFPNELFYYPIIYLSYISLKLLFLAMRWGYSKLSTRFGNKSHQGRFRRHSRRTHRSLKLK